MCSWEFILCSFPRPSFILSWLKFIHSRLHTKFFIFTELFCRCYVRLGGVFHVYLCFATKSFNKDSIGLELRIWAKRVSSSTSSKVIYDIALGHYREIKSTAWPLRDWIDAVSRETLKFFIFLIMKPSHILLLYHF